MKTQPSQQNAGRARRRAAEVAIVGAGPIGLMIANFLGLKGISVVVLEQLDNLIDFPRAIGLDDESLRTFQAVGLSQKVEPHTTPMHWMRFVTPKGRCFASIEPRVDDFGWPRRNAFIQPLADRVLLEGLDRFDSVEVLFSRKVSGFEQNGDGVIVRMEDGEGNSENLQARYLIGCDGGNSQVRRALNIPFEGKTAPNQWIVIDVRNDPLGTPNVYLHCDTQRPYVSAALPHGIRRFEFMVMPGETEETLAKPENMRRLLQKVVPDPDRVDIIRSRVYTHNARIAARFRQGRIFLAGDAAHIMPVWQGQGYNSGIRDAANLAWKLAMVLQGQAGDRLLDSYEQERRGHAKAMIDLSVMAGHVLAPPKAWQGRLRDGVSWLLNYLPPIKRYFLEMRFKPMPTYEKGLVVACPEAGKNSPVGRLFIQPRVDHDGETVRLDEVIGNHFAIIAWGTDPTRGLTDEQLRRWRGLGARFVSVVPSVQLRHHVEMSDEVVRIGDHQGRLKEWFGGQPLSIAIVRPDRFVAGLASPQTLGRVLDDTAEQLGASASKTCRESPRSEVA
ncbi:MAG: bifunctional 3-(3-hydroxy-phenyl)propionate/3-hydroxycinnamic acid hydroxylase [Candidatus Thiodiazotropha sp.]